MAALQGRRMTDDDFTQDWMLSDKLTHVCVVDGDGAIAWRGVCATDPEVIAKTLGRHARGARARGAGDRSRYRRSSTMAWSSVVCR